jgi:hypothetical protein
MTFIELTKGQKLEALNILRQIGYKASDKDKLQYLIKNEKLVIRDANFKFKFLK